MMDPSNINGFEDQWRRALQEASETPPPAVWASIEAHLDKGQEKVVPLWWQSPKMWYAAASIAALLLVGGGLWYSGVKDEKVQVAANTKPVQKSSSEGQELITERSKVNEDQNVDQLASAPQSKIEPAKAGEPNLENSKIGISGTGKVDIAARYNATVSAQKPLNSFSKAKEPVLETTNLATADIPQNVLTKDGINEVAVETNISNPLTSGIASSKIAGNSNAAAAVNENQPISAQLLASLPYSDLDIYVQKRIVFFRPEIRIEEPVKASKPKEYYAGIGVMPASFNPDVQLKEAPMAFSAQSVSQRRSVTGSSEARASYAVQTQGGVRLSKHWSVETGISYLRGNSAYEGGGYVLNAYNSAAANVLENALAGLPAAANADKAANFTNGALYIDVAKKVSNNYQYLQLPVQAGFTLNADKKFSYSLLGGIMANFFLANELESASGDIIRTTASDEIYRGMNWAATTGLRLNYKLSSNWGANLTGSYQKAVSSGFKSNQSLDSHPYLYGVSWSVRYSF
ncbi:outer membrane beta-barrel protein [Dyadobacter sp. CY261]|uniref:outer membrane beta-barrel protein n=1 Tax=Dyadobacter sp. CY261 TaxID=2907203 RepID=UPI001F21B062|nr:outer membrane beta-barrel protein [Dyadobacter sp. CY261]MCF0071688.1 outer membrane beta-barrel protein [Dyadobacter sp. CY261]